MCGIVILLCDQLVVIANAEIFNFKALAAQVGVDEKLLASDCDVISHVFEKLCDRRDIGKLASMLDGLFAVAIFDVSASTLYLARDPIGVAPLYVGVGVNGVLMVSSELKGLTHPSLARVEQFPPGFTATVHVDFASNANAVADLVTPVLFSSPTVNGLVHRAIAYRKYWSAFDVVNVPDATALALPSFEAQFEFWARRLHDALVAAIVKRVELCDVPFAVLLSGGLDSSIVAATAARHIKHKRGADAKLLHTFSVGMADSPDCAAAELVAAHIHSIHEQRLFTFEEGLNALHDVIFAIETYDQTTIRSSTPMSLLIRLIKAGGMKMILSGEGSDELFGGYLYFHHCPSPAAFDEESRKKVAQLYHYDVLRCNHVAPMHGAEIRVPFLDKQVVELALRDIPAQFKMPLPRPGAADQKKRIEKCLLRHAFEGYLPESVLWRQKEQFSDGVGSGWIDQLKLYANEVVSDERFAKRAELYAFQTPANKEQMLYRDIFEDAFADSPASSKQSSQSVVFTQTSVACSTETAAKWIAMRSTADADPSGRNVV